MSDRLAPFPTAGAIRSPVAEGERPASAASFLTQLATLPALPFIAAGAIAWLLHLRATPWAWSLVTALLALFALLIHLRARRLPRWLPPLVALLALLAIRPIFGYGFGQETALALLTAVTWLKGWETHSPRDLRAWGLTLAFLLTTAFLRSQTPLTALAVATGWGLLLFGWIAAVRLEWGIPLTSSDRRALGRQLGATTLAILPLALLLFVLVPRLERPLWGIPHDAARGKTGLSERVAPGSISALALSEEVALSLTWEGTPPPASLLYLRAVVLTEYDGREWRPASSLPAGGVERKGGIQSPLRPDDRQGTKLPSPPVDRQGIESSSFVANHQATAPTHFTLLLAPQPIPWLPLPEKTVALSGATPAQPLADGRWQANRPLLERTLWRGTVQLSDRWVQPLTLAEQIHLTRLPAESDPRAQALGRALATRHPDPFERLAAIAEAFRAAGLRYTLTPPLMTHNPADQTLFDVRAGFCEHFAHAFAVVARAAGLPTRLVTGYQGATYNPADGSWVVRHADAHAWAEVWIDGVWLRVDPTQWSAPDRLELGSTAALRDQLPRWQTLWFESPLLAAVRQQLWAWQRQWDLWVVGFDAARQQQLWRRVGWDEGFAAQALILFGVTAATLALLVLLPFSVHRRNRVAAAWEAVQRQLASLGITRAAHEPLLPFCHRLETHLPAPLARAAVAALHQLIAYRYGSEQDAPTPQTLITALRQLRWRLVCYRWSRFLKRSC